MFTSRTSKTSVFAAFSSGADAYCVKCGQLSILLTAIVAVSQGGSYLAPQIASQVLQEFKSEASAKPPANLSDREFKVLKLLVEGYNNSKIASELFLSPNTVKAHIKSLMRKFSVRDRVQLVVKALRTGLV